MADKKPPPPPPPRSVRGNFNEKSPAKKPTTPKGLQHPKRSKSSNHTLHRTPEVMAFFAFATFGIKRRFCQDLIGFWCR